MAVRLRLRREGAKKKPHFRVVAADQRSPRDGRYIEIIGEYHPAEDPSRIEIDEERALHWLHNGAQPSESVKNLLRIVGVWERFKPGDAPQRERVARPAETEDRAEATRASQGDAAAEQTSEAPEEVTGAPEEATAEPVAESDAAESSTPAPAGTDEDEEETS